MNEQSLDDLIAASNPIESESAEKLDVDSAQKELMNGVLSTGVRTRAVKRPSTPSRSRWRLPGLGIAAAAIAAIAVAVLLVGSGSDPTSSNSAWAAEQVRFAEASPLVLLDLPGWKVSYANEESKTDGEMSFFYAPDKKANRLTDPSLHWRQNPISNWYEDRAASAVWQATAPVLGTTARVYEYGVTDGMHTLTALWELDGRVLEYRSQVPDRLTFEEQLGALVKVDVDDWLSALPKSSIPVADRSLAIGEMLEGVPMPPGFDPATIEGDGLTKDVASLEVYVTLTVACTWMDRWAKARAQGEEAEARKVADAMATARDWPTADSIAGRDVVKVADAIPEGTLLGQPLEKQFRRSLGCSAVGVDLRKP